MLFILKFERGGWILWTVGGKWGGLSGGRPATVRGASGDHAYTISILSLSQDYPGIGLVPLGGAFRAGVDAG